MCFSGNRREFLKNGADATFALPWVTPVAFEPGVTNKPASQIQNDFLAVGCEAGRFHCWRSMRDEMSRK